MVAVGVVEPGERLVEQRAQPVGRAGDLAFLLVLASPVLGMNIGAAGISTLPDRLTSKQGFLALERSFPGSGSDPAEIVVSMLGPAVYIDRPAPPGTAVIGGTAQQIIDQLGAYSRAGLDHAILLPSFAPHAGENTPVRAMEAMDFLASEVLPALQ